MAKKIEGINTFINIKNPNFLNTFNDFWKFSYVTFVGFLFSMFSRMYIT